MAHSFNLLPFEQQHRVFTNAKISHNLSMLAQLYSPKCTLCNDDLSELSDLLDDFTNKIYNYVTEKLNSSADTAPSEDEVCVKKDS